MILHSSSTLIPAKTCGLEPDTMDFAKGTGGDSASNTSTVQGGSLSKVRPYGSVNLPSETIFPQIRTC